MQRNPTWVFDADQWCSAKRALGHCRLVAITRQKIGIGVSYTLYLEALTSLANDAMFAAGASTRLKL
jgi:hypothetical protein